MRKKTWKNRYMSRCYFSTILFNGTICAYNSCIFLSINNHSYPLVSFLHQNLDLGAVEHTKGD